MSLLISYSKYQDNWYVGELYDYFVKYLQKTYGDVSIVSISDLAQKYNEPVGYRTNGLSSVFNIYNLIICNTKNNTGFLHSLADYAPVILEHRSALEKLNIISMAFSSNFTQDIIDKYAYLNIKLIPSFYILENWNDFEYIKQYRHRINSQIDKCYFNGLCYGHREYYIKNLKHNPFFVMKNKREVSDYRNKNEYYQELSSYKYGISLNGAAKICYRDLEYFGLGVLCIREPLSIMTKDILEPDVHYKLILDDYVQKNIYYEEKKEQVGQYIQDKINNITSDEYDFIVNNAYRWYISNTDPDNQIKFLEKCLIENNIL